MSNFVRETIKKMKTKFGLLFIVMVVMSAFLFQSCKKEKTQTNMIIKNWTLVSKNLSDSGSSIMTECEKNSKWNFQVENLYVIKDNCDNTLSGTWSLDEDGKTLTLDNNTSYSVVENSLLRLVIEKQVDGDGLVRWTFI